MAPLVPEVDLGDHVDEAIFEQILDMDDEDDPTHEFSRSIVMDFLDQAEATINKMENLLTEKDLPGLSGQGHFLKGSSATLGFVHIRDACEKIQHYGHQQEPDGVTRIEKDKALDLIRHSLEEVVTAYETIKALMTRYYEKLDG